MASFLVVKIALTIREGKTNKTVGSQPPPLPASPVPDPRAQPCLKILMKVPHPPLMGDQSTHMWQAGPGTAPPTAPLLSVPAFSLPGRVEAPWVSQLLIWVWAPKVPPSPATPAEVPGPQAGERMWLGHSSLREPSHPAQPSRSSLALGLRKAGLASRKQQADGTGAMF